MSTSSFTRHICLYLVAPVLLLVTVAMASMLLAPKPAMSQVPAADTTCHGEFVNPITDICWDCIFPISLGSFELIGGRPDPENPSNPICFCGTPIPRIGLTIGFWEPVRLVDVTRNPFCFVNLGGLEIAPGGNWGVGKRTANRGGSSKSFFHVHWYMYPLIYWLEVLMDFLCLEEGSFDLAYITELDPLWSDDELTFFLNPEAILFGNPIAQAACAADCGAASTGLPLDPLFWCAGCQGGMYPLDGNIQADVGGVQASVLATERMAYKLHRELVLWGTAGEEALCHKYPMPVIRKSQYRTQMVNPVPQTSGDNACPPMGRTTTLYEANRELPVVGEDFGYLIWRKRNCCAL